jgi:hypothetical protein
MVMVMVRTINFWYILLSLEETDVVTLRLPENERKQGELSRQTCPMYGTTETCGQILDTSSIYKNKKKYLYQHVS